MEHKVELPESGHIAHLKTSITYGESQAIQATLMAGTKGKINPVTKEYEADLNPGATTEWIFKKMLIVITRFNDKDGKVLPVTRATIEGLPVSDGELLEKEVDAILDRVKKN